MPSFHCQYAVKDIIKAPNIRNPFKPFGLLIAYSLYAVFVVPMLKSNF